MAAVRWFNGSDAAACAALWPVLSDQGWLRHPGRVVIHLASTARSALAVGTARSLVDYLLASSRPPRIAVIDVRGDAASWAPAEFLDLRQQIRYRVESPCLRDGALVPQLWLDEFLPITIAAAHPDAAYRLASVLVAQAELLDAPNGRDLHRVFEAHRLLAPAVGVVCGSIDFAGNAPVWWAASDCDVALETEVARAAGLDPTTLPHLRCLARHELAAFRVKDVRGPVPSLRGYATSLTRTHVERARRECGHACALVGEDLVRGAANLRRIPDFIRRHWPALTGGSVV